MHGKTAADYKILYEQTLLKLAAPQEESLEMIAERGGRITELSFELDKSRKYLFGQKSEKFPLQSTDTNQIHQFEQFEEETTQEQREEI